MTLLKVTNLSTEIQLADNTIQAVKNISFEIARGQTLALVGESGSGKSISALSIARLLPDAGKIVAGEVLLEGQNILSYSEKEMREVRGRRIAMIFQEPMTSLNPVIKIGDQITENIFQHEKVAKKIAFERSVELLDAVGLPTPRRIMSEYPHELSGGMLQRVMIAIALASNPDLLIADEPTTALDVTIQAQVLELLHKLQQDLQMGLLFITHDLGVVQKIADEVAVMRHGEIVEQANNVAFFAAPQHEYSQQLLNAVPSFAKRGKRLSVQLSDDEISASSNESDALDDMQTVLDVQKLQVYFPIREGLFKRTTGYVKAVKDVSIQLFSGQTLALVGESGCGKTTVGKSILRLLDVTQGSILFDGKDLLALQGEQLRAKRRELQIVFQDPYSSLNPRMLVGDIIEEGMISLGVETDSLARKKEVVKLLDQVGLPENSLRRYPHEFSGGQRQRICIARALAVRPKLIICDEPTSALDVSVQAQVLNLLKDLQHELGMSYLFITHDMSVVSYLADEVAVMHQGEIVERGTTEQILFNAKHEYTRSLLAAVPRLVLN